MAYQHQLVNLDHHHYDNYKENGYAGSSGLFGGSYPAAKYNSQKVNLDEFSSDDDDSSVQVPPGGYIYDDLTTTSGSDFMATEAFTSTYKRPRKKYNERSRHLGNNFPSMSTIYNLDKYVSSDDDDDLTEDSTPPRLRNLQLVTPLTPINPNHGRRTRNLEMIEEISPVLPANRTHESDEMPPKLKPISISKKWNPVQTSTTTSFAPPPIPKTNPRHIGVTSTPRSMAPSSSHASSHQGRRYVIDPVDSTTAAYMTTRPPKVFAKPDHFGLPTQVADKHQSRGIMYLSIKIRRLTVTVHIQNATYFLDPSRPITSFVKVESKPHLPSARHPNREPNPRKRKAQEARRPFDSFKSELADRTNSPSFFETYRFKLTEANIRANDVISISVFSRTPAGLGTDSERELLGCMAFPLVNLFKKADLLHDHRRGYIENTNEYVNVARGGFFLLGKTYGSVNHLSESKIRHSKYYDEIGGSSISTCSSSGVSSSPIKPRMMAESGWRPSTSCNRPDAMLNRLGVSPLKEGSVRSGPISIDYNPAPGTSMAYQGSSSGGSNGYPGHKKRVSLTNALVNGNDSPCTSSSGSSLRMPVNGVCEFSTSNSSYSTNGGVEFNSRSGKKFVMPSILTTSDSNLSRHHSTERNQPVNTDMLYANTPMSFHQRHLAMIDDDNDDDSEAKDVMEASRIRFDSVGAREIQNDAYKVASKMGHSSVRRVASFTSPPTKNQVAKSSQLKDREHRRGFFGKTLHFLRNKVDSTMSLQVVYPTIDEAKAWSKMEVILESKTGVLFFAQFLDNEFCRENLDFSLKCREYKKLFRNPKKYHKKIARLAKEIYDQFLDDSAPQEVNLEASVRSATRAALAGELREDTFSLAQSKIEQLLANDKYQRFLKSDIYQDLLNRSTRGSTISLQSPHPELPLSSSDGESTPCATSNEETPIAPNQNDRQTLRSVSAVNRIDE